MDRQLKQTALPCRWLGGEHFGRHYSALTRASASADVAGRVGSAFLKTGLAACEPRPDMFDRLAGIVGSVAVRGDVHHAEVNTENVGRVDNLGIVHIAEVLMTNGEIMAWLDNARRADRNAVRRAWREAEAAYGPGGLLGATWAARQTAALVAAEIEIVRLTWRQRRKEAA